MVDRRALALATSLFLAFGPAASADARLPSEGLDDLETAAIGVPDDLSALVTGRWTGRGEVLVKMSQARPYNVRCDFEGGGDRASITMEGECGALFVKRGIAFALNQTETGLTGTYDAALRTGVADLVGTRAGDKVDLEIDWNGEVNGDTVASMSIERQGEDALRIVVRDLDPETGEERITTDLSLTRQ